MLGSGQAGESGTQSSLGKCINFLLLPYQNKLVAYNNTSLSPYNSGSQQYE